MTRAIWLVLTVFAWIAPAHAVDPAEKLADPALEARAETLGHGLRCLVCQSESIEESSADLAHDLRVIVRERIVAGDSDDQVRKFVVSRYGDYVLLQPPFNPTTLFLWAGPIVMLLIAFGVAGLFFRRRGASPVEEPLSTEDRRRLDALLRDGGKR